MTKKYEGPIEMGELLKKFDAIEVLDRENKCTELMYVIGRHRTKELKAAKKIVDYVDPVGIKEKIILWRRPGDKVWKNAVRSGDFLTFKR